MRVADILQLETIAVYPGRFQPFHPGHKAVYDKVVEQFGHCYIATSNVVNERSPLDFETRKSLIVASGVPSEYVIEVASPMRSDLVIERLGRKPEMIRYIVAVGEKDVDRFKFDEAGTTHKKDGGLGYYRRFNNSTEAADTRGQVIVIENVVNSTGNIYNSTDLRELLSRSDETQARQVFEELYGEQNGSFDTIRRAIVQKGQSNIR